MVSDSDCDSAVTVLWLCCDCAVSMRCGCVFICAWICGGVLGLCAVAVCCGCVLWLCAVAVCCGCVLGLCAVAVCCGCVLWLCAVPRDLCVALIGEIDGGPTTCTPHDIYACMTHSHQVHSHYPGKIATSELAEKRYAVSRCAHACTHHSN